MLITNTASIYPYLLPTLYASQMIYNMADTPADALYVKRKSYQLWEFFAHTKPLGEAPEKFEGSPTGQDTIEVMWQFSAQQKFFGLTLPITFEALKYNLYEQFIPQHVKLLQNSHIQTRNKRAIEPFVNGFTAITYDTQPLFSTSHPTAVGTYSNTIGVPTQFNEQACEDMEILLSGMTDDAGNLIQAASYSVHVGPFNQFNAKRVLSNPDRPATANRDINALYHMDRYPGGIHVNPYFGPDWTDWYIKVRGMDKGLDDGTGALHLTSEEFRIDPFSDERIKTIQLISYEAYLYVIWCNRQFAGIQGLA